MNESEHGRRFDAAYREEVRLNDGSAAALRLVRPSDKELLQEGFRRLSPESRYRRFFSFKHELSPAELRYFTECDGENHFAIGATRELPDGSEEGIGVARFVRIPEEQDCADAAIAVVDDWQGKGLGHLLLARLVEAAEERGVWHFRVSVLADNPPVFSLIEENAAHVREVSRDGGTVVVDVHLPKIEPGREAPKESPLYRLFSSVARGVARVHWPRPWGTGAEQ